MFQRVRPRNKAADIGLIVGALLVGVGVGALLLSRSAKKTQQQHVEKLRDKALKDSYPASDPPASQYFDIPVNRM
jgi:hypothetical protein